jgi:hypothetical protein
VVLNWENVDWQWVAPGEIAKLEMVPLLDAT